MIALLINPLCAYIETIPEITNQEVEAFAFFHRNLGTKDIECQELLAHRDAGSLNSNWLESSERRNRLQTRPNGAGEGADCSFCCTSQLIEI
jgi:hypothetical protein